MILLPIGHEEEGVRRLPWVTFAIMIVCVLAFFTTGRHALFSKDDGEVSEQAGRAMQYYLEHPYLELDPEFEKRVVTGERSRDQFRALIEAYRGVAGPTPAARESEQQVLDGLVDAALASIAGHPLMRWGLIPDHVSFPALFTHMFLHAGWLHLIGNLLILYLAGPFIEDVWGRPLFLAFYLLSGITAALLHIAFQPHSSVPMIGASGAIAGVMGAFLIRYRTTRIRFFYMFGLLFRGTFAAPAWVMLPLWFGQQLFFGMLTRNANNDGAGVAHWAHVGGFVFGLGVAFAMRAARVEERVLHPAIVDKIDTSVVANRVVEEAFEADHAGDGERAFALLLSETARAPANVDAALALWQLALETGREIEAAPAMVKAIDVGLRSGDVDHAVAQWAELRERVPTLAVEPSWLLRVARGFLRAGRTAEAGAALRHALLNAGGAPGASTALRIAELASQVEPGLARAAARLALVQSDLDPDARLRAERLLSTAGGVVVSSTTGPGVGTT